MRILVTGGAGFIGSTLTDRLLADGHDVVVIDNLSRGRLDNLADARRVNNERPHAFTFHRIDINDPALPEAVATARPEVVFHLAAQIDVRVSVADPVLDTTTNVLGTVALLDACRRAGVRKVVFASSGGSIYGAPAKLPVTERAGVDPMSPYAAAKAAGELYLSAFTSLYGLEYTSLALGNVYGPRQDPHGEAGVVAIFLGAMLEHRPTRIFGDGTASRDFVFVDDVVDALVRAAGSRGSGRRFNVGSGVAVTVRDLHRLVAETLGLPDEPQFAPGRLGELQAIALDCTAARRTLGWEPFTPLPAGLAATAEWIRARAGEATG